MKDCSILWVAAAAATTADDDKMKMMTIDAVF